MLNDTSKIDKSDLEIWSNFLENIENDSPKSFRIFLIVSMYTAFFMSIVGNGLTCIVISRDRSMHTATNFYLYNLAISDIIVACAIFVEVHEHIMKFEMFTLPSFEGIVCKIYFLFIMGLWNNGILIMTALAIERYLAICYPLVLKSRPVVRRVSKIIMLIWLIAIIETVPEWWSVEMLSTKKSSTCFTVPTTYARIVNGVMGVVGFLIPLIIMTFVYTMIVYEVRASHRSGVHDKVFNQRDNRKKVHKLVVLTLSFLICWLPFFAMRMTILVYDVRQLVKMKWWWRIGFNLCTINCWFSTAINPIVFSLMSTKFRKSLKKLWKNKCMKDHTAIPTSIV